jgi:hypothetical protein
VPCLEEIIGAGNIEQRFWSKLCKSATPAPPPSVENFQRKFLTSASCKICRSISIFIRRVKQQKKSKEAVSARSYVQKICFFLNPKRNALDLEIASLE